MREGWGDGMEWGEGWDGMRDGMPFEEVRRHVKIPFESVLAVIPQLEMRFEFGGVVLELLQIEP